MNQTYISFDVETDGPVPGPHSMLSFGAVAFTPEGREIGEFSVNIKELQRAKRDPETMKFWAKFPDQWAALQVDRQLPEEAARGIVEWATSLPGELVFAADPAAWDGMFLNYYLAQYSGIRSFDDLPWRHRVLDIRTLAMVALDCPYHEAHKSRMDRAYKLEQFDDADGLVAHVALDDARAQGRRLVKVLQSLGDFRS